jgi:hypothetical protein
MPEPKKHPSLSVPDPTPARIQVLCELLPEAFSEGKIISSSTPNHLRTR